MEKQPIRHARWDIARWGVALCTLVWLVVLTVPELRSIFSRQLTQYNYMGWESGGAPAAPSFILDITSHLKSAVLTPPSDEETLKRYPNDARIRLGLTLNKAQQALLGAVDLPAYDGPARRATKQAWNAAPISVGLGRGRGASELAWLGSCDQAIKQSPHDAALIAARMIFAVRGPYGYLEHGDFSKTVYPNSPTRQQMEGDLAIAQLGRSAEPDNCFYDMMAAEILFVLHRDGEGFAMLSEGAAKPRYDDHIMDATRALIAVRELGGSLDPVDKLSLMAAALYPHLVHHRRLARFVVWRGSLAEKAGDHARALQIYGDVAHLGTRMRDSAHVYITALVGVAIQSLAWSRGSESRTSGRTASRTNRDQESQVKAQAFASYARQHGRADLGDEAIKAAEAGRLLRLQGNLYVENLKHDFAPFSGIVRYNWMATALLSQCLWTAAAWLLLFALGSRRRDDLAEAQPVSPVDFAGTALWVNGAIVVLLLPFFAPSLLPASSALRALLAPSPEFEGGNSNAAQVLSWLRSAIVFIPVVGAAILCFIGMMRRKTKSAATLQGQNEATAEQIRKRQTVRKAVLAGAAIIVLPLLWTALGGKLPDWFAPLVSAIIPAAGVGGVLLQLWQWRRAGHIGRTRGVLRYVGWTLAAVALYSAFCILLYSVLYGVFAVDSRLVTFDNAFVFGFYLILGAGAIAIIRSLAKTGFFSNYGIRWYRASLGATIVAGSLLYLGISLASLPARHRTQAWLDRSLTQGEMSFIRQLPAQQFSEKSTSSQ